MAEVIGLAASIIQIGGSGAKLSKELYVFISTAVRADQDMDMIARDVGTTSCVLANVGKVLEADDAIKIINQDAVKHARDLIKQCEEVFEEILAVLEKRRKFSEDGKRRLSLMGRISWPMKEQRVELLRRRLETLKSSLLVLFHVLQLAQSQSRGDVEKASLEEQRKSIRQVHKQQQDSLEILRALEKRLCSVKIDDDPILQGSRPPPRTSSNEPRASQIMVTAAMDTKENKQVTDNKVAMSIFAANLSETSESDMTSTDEEGEQLTAAELSKCASNVQKLLRRITKLQTEVGNDHCTRIPSKRRIHKMYKRFCNKFEADVVNASPTHQSQVTESNMDRKMMQIHAKSSRLSQSTPSRAYAFLTTPPPSASCGDNDLINHDALSESEKQYVSTWTGAKDFLHDVDRARAHQIENMQQEQAMTVQHAQHQSGENYQPGSVAFAFENLDRLSHAGVQESLARLSIHSLTTSMLTDAEQVARDSPIREPNESLEISEEECQLESQTTTTSAVVALPTAYLEFPPSMQPMNPVLETWMKANTNSFSQDFSIKTDSTGVISSFDAAFGGQQQTPPNHFSTDPAHQRSFTSMSFDMISTTPVDMPTMNAPFSGGEVAREFHDTTTTAGSPHFPDVPQPSSPTTPSTSWANVCLHDHVSSYDFSETSAIVFDASQSLHIRTLSESTNQSHATSTLGSAENAFPMNLPISESFISPKYSDIGHRLAPDHDCTEFISPNQSASLPFAPIEPIVIQQPAGSSTSLTELAASSPRGARRGKPATSSVDTSTNTMKTIVKKTPAHTTKRDTTGIKRVGRRHGPLQPHHLQQAHEICSRPNTASGATGGALETFDFDSFMHSGELTAMDGLLNATPNNEQDNSFVMESKEKEPLALEQKDTKLLEAFQEQEIPGVPEVCVAGGKREVLAQEQIGTRRSHQGLCADCHADDDSRARCESLSPTTANVDLDMGFIAPPSDSSKSDPSQGFRRKCKSTETLGGRTLHHSHRASVTMVPPRFGNTVDWADGGIIYMRKGTRVMMDDEDEDGVAWKDGDRDIVDVLLEKWTIPVSS